MHAAQQDARFINGTREGIPKHLGVASQSLQEPDERVVSPGHHVGQHQLLLVRQCESRLQPRQIRGLDNRGFVGEHVEAGFERGDDAINLAAVAAREDGDPAGGSSRIRSRKSGPACTASRQSVAACGRRLYLAIRLK